MTEFMEDILSEKYIYVSKDIDIFSEKENYKYIGENDYSRVYKNINSLSLGFGVNSNMSKYSVKSENPFDNINSLAQNMANVSDLYYEIIPEYSIQAEGCEITPKNADYLCLENKISDYAKEKVEISFDTFMDGEYYINILNAGYKKISLYINDEFKRDYIVSSCGIMYIGSLKDRDAVRFEIVNYEKTGYRVDNEEIGLRVAVSDNAEINKFHRAVNSNQLNISSVESSDHIEGNVTLDNDKILFTSIPFDEGWHVYEDGKEVEKIKLANAFIGLDLGAGEHYLTFRYNPQGLTIGIAITVISCLTFIIWMMILYRKEKNQIVDLEEEE